MIANNKAARMYVCVMREGNRERETRKGGAASVVGKENIYNNNMIVREGRREERGRCKS